MKSKQEKLNEVDITIESLVQPRTKEIPQLNDDCLEHIVKFLEPGDIINFWLTTNRFKFIVARNIRNKLFDLTELGRCGFQGNTVKEFFSINQNEIRHLAFHNLQETEKLVDFEFLLVHCHNLEEIQMNIHTNDELHRQPLSRFLAVQKKLRKFIIGGDFQDIMDILETVATHCPNLEEVNIQIKPSEDPIKEAPSYDFISQMQKLKVFKIDCIAGDKIARELAKIKDLNVLHMTSCQVTGRHLTTLKKLKELNLNGCYRLQVHHLNEILRVNTDLKKLNIAYCCIQFRTFTGSAAVQNNLEWIELNSCFYTSFDVPRLKNLKHIRIFEIARFIPRLERFLKNLSNHHRDRIETLEIYNRSLALETNDCALVPSFRNLRRLALRGVKGLDDQYLLGISKACSHLEVVDLWDSGASITAEGLVEFIRGLKRLQCLKISNFSSFSPALYFQIVQTQSVDTPTKFPLKIYLRCANFPQKFLETHEYFDSQKLVKLISEHDALADFF